MVLNKTLKTMLKKEEAEIKRLENELEKHRKKVDAIKVLGDEDPIKESQLSIPTVSGQKKRGDVSANIRAAVNAMKTSFLTKDLTDELAEHGHKYPSSTISTTLLKFLKLGILKEGEKMGKGKTYVKA